MANLLAGAERKKRRPALLSLRSMIGGLGLLAATLMGGTAEAQTVDWLVGIDDAGFENAPAGAIIEYDVNVVNNGFGSAPATTLSFDFPGGTTFVDGVRGSPGIGSCVSRDSGATAPVIGPATMVCDVAPLSEQGGGSDTATFVAKLKTSEEGVVTVTAAVDDKDDIDGDATNDRLSENTTVAAGSELGLTLTAPTSAAAGERITLDWTVTNNGPNVANRLTFEFPVPAGLTNFSSVPTGCGRSGAAYICAVTNVEIGATRRLSFEAQVSAAGASTITPAASVTATSPRDGDTTNNTASGNVAISGGTDLYVDLTRSPTSWLRVGDAVRFVVATGYTGDNPNEISLLTQIPANYRVDSIADGPWTCSPRPTTGVNGPIGITCTQPSGSGAGANVDLGTVLIDATAIGEGSNALTTSTISATTPTDTNPANNTDDDGGVVIEASTIDLRANKTGPNPALSVVGSEYRFAISTTNVGTADFDGTIRMVDLIPSGMEVIGLSTNGWNCSPAAPPDRSGPVEIACSRSYSQAAPLGVGRTTPTVQVTTRIIQAGDLTNTVEVSSSDSNLLDENPENDRTEFTVRANAGPDSADIGLRKSAEARSVVSGDLQTFTLQVTNDGPATAKDVELTDTFLGLTNSRAGAGEGFDSFSISAGDATGVSCSTRAVGGGRRLTCTIDALPVCTPGATCPTIVATVRPGGDSGSRTNTASVISLTTPDPDLSDRTDTASFTVTPRTDVTVTKVATPDPVNAGQDLTYVVAAETVRNGQSRADAVTITDTLPRDVVFVSATPSSGQCSTAPATGSRTRPGNDEVVCALGNISQGSQQTVRIVVRPTNAQSGGTITNGVNVTTTTDETDLTNNDDNVTVAVRDPDLDLLVNKDDSVDPVAIGQTLTYRIDVQNLGPSASENVVVTDPLPTSKVAFQSYTVSGDGRCDTVPSAGQVGGEMRCSFPYLAPGASERVTVTLDAIEKGSVLNTVEISSDEILAGFERQSANNINSENTTIRSRGDLQVASKTASKSVVGLRESFDFVVNVRNNPGTGRAEIDGVRVTDALPSGMVLTGTPTAVVTTGTASANACTGTANGSTFACDFGTLSSGGEIEITVPVKVVAIAESGATLVNTASATTSSLDEVPDNNTASGSVTVTASSLSGTVFLDFADDAVLNGSDFGLADVPLTLTGTASDGEAVSLPATTGANGDFLFDDVPQGTYTVTRGAPGIPGRNGTNTAGSSGGSIVSPTEIASVILPADTDARGYLFPIVPQASIGIAKQAVGAPTIAADGSFIQTFALTVENFSQEPVTATVTDPLAGATPLFGVLAAPAAPATDALAPGSYAITSAPAGNCNGLNPVFNGSDRTVVANGITLAAEGSCSLTFQVRVQPTAPLPPVRVSGGRYENQAIVTGAGDLSGQTPSTVPTLTDRSDNGADPDPDGNGNATETGENDPTPVTPGYAPAIALVKTADISALSDPAQVGDIVTYNFSVTNQGDVTLRDVTVTETLDGVTLSGGPIAELAPGDTVTAVTGTYAITQRDLNVGEVTNAAIVSGIDPFGTEVIDESGETVESDEPLTTPLLPEPAIRLIKTADASAVSDPAELGQIIQYGFIVTNTGNATLSNISLVDSLEGVVLTGGPIANLEPGQQDSTTFTGSYALTQADLDAGRVVNSAVTTGTPPSGLDVTDTSGTRNDNDTPTVTTLAGGPGIALDKIADDSATADGLDAGDIITYAFSITNTGQVTLSDVTLADPLPGLVLTGGPIASLAPGETDETTYTARYTVTADDVANGLVTNTATATGSYGPDDAFQISDSDTETAGTTIDAEPEVFEPFAEDGGTTTSMLASDTLNGAPATVSTVIIEVLEADDGVTLDTGTGLITLAPGNPAGAYEIEYRICAIAEPALCDTAIETVFQGTLPALEVTKTQEFVDNGDGTFSAGDVVDYTITVQNTGNVAMTATEIEDQLTSFEGQTLELTTGPDFEGTDLGSSAGDLAVGETATYTATFEITDEAVAAGGVSNIAIATADSVVPDGVPGNPTTVSDTSDDGVDTDGNMVDDSTQLAFAPLGADNTLSMTKTTPRSVVERGAIVLYTIRIENTAAFPQGPIRVVDTLPPNFHYVLDSASVAPTSVTNGRRIVWEDLEVPADGALSLTLRARILNGVQSGEHVNRADLMDPESGRRVLPTARAVVTILPEAVFDCGDVIGKVFEDHNGNGYQDSPRRATGITDQSYEPDAKYTGKHEVAKPRDTAEHGIPNVRLATVDGLVVTTDANGLYSVPCADLPRKRGTNFILKLDERTLPTGFRMTTENPRVHRLTPGMVTEMNFGASPSRVVRIDLGPAAFSGSSLAPGLAAGIEQLLPQIAGEVATIRLAFHLPASAAADAVGAARHRMGTVERHLRDRWRAVGRTRLAIEQTIVRTGQ